MTPAPFFATLRAAFGPLSQPQVDGINAILTAWAGRDPRHTAYALGTAFHETARTMQPIREMGGAAYFRRMYDLQGERPHVAGHSATPTPATA